MKKYLFCFTCAVVTLSVMAQQQEITLDKIWKSGEFAAKSISGLRSMNDGLHYTSTVYSGGVQAIVKYSYATGKAVDTLFTSRGKKLLSGAPFNFGSYEFNATESKLLLATESESVYRHSSRSNYYAWDIRTRVLKPITDFEKGRQELADFSPVGNTVAFVRDNNLYLSNIDTETETQITVDGQWGEIINGALDWVYEEEFSFHKGFYWSPAGTKLAYYRFDESEVPEFNMAMYAGLYPELYTYKYPKAGERNAEVRIFVYDLVLGTSREVEIGASAEQYIPRIAWTIDDDKLCVMRMNRHQNHLEFLLADASRLSGSTIPVRIIYDEKSDTYIDINDNLIFLEGGRYFLWNSERDGWNHIYIYSLDGKLAGQITRGPWEVIDFYGVDPRTRTVYFSAALDGPLGSEVYSASYGDILRQYERTGRAVDPPADSRSRLGKLTPNGNSNRAVFSSGFRYFINYQSGAGTPPYISLHDAKGKKIRDLETNSALKERLVKYALPAKEFDTFTTDAGHALHYSIIKPPQFDPAKPYPLIFMVYGGPGSNRVANSWGGNDYFWHQMLAQKGYIVVSVDPRGTMKRGRDFKHSTYLQLGKLETEDFIASAKYFGSLPYVDASRIGIMGWSYGGYMSSLCMTKGADHFKLGIAVAPVTNWRYYDSIYTERFLRTPQENPTGYDDNSPINFVDKLKGHYLLVHGSADDNVHYQNTMEMVKALVNANKHFDLHIYPDKNHGIYGGNTRYHLFTKMTDFIESNL